MRRALVLLLTCLACATTAPTTVVDRPFKSVPYEPSLNLLAMDQSANPCVDFYAYTCGGWKKRNPIPADQSSWSVYGKLEMENLQFLWGVLEEAAQDKPGRSTVDQKVGDYFAACMDTSAIEKVGMKPLLPALAEISSLTSTEQLASLLGKLHRQTADGSLAFAFGSAQDFANSERVIGQVAAGGLGLPDRDYYFRADAKSVEQRQRYVEHVAKMLVLTGEEAAAAKSESEAILKLETALAGASLTNVEKRDPHNIAHHATLAELQGMTPGFDWNAYLSATGAATVDFFNVAEPKFEAEFAKQLTATDLPTWKAYLRWHLAQSSASALGGALDDESFAFYSRYLGGTESQPPRWKRCVSWVDRDLGEALGQAYVERVFTPDVKQRTVTMTRFIEEAMEQDLKTLTWMSEATRQAALVKLHAVANKVGYPDHWRDYSSVGITRGDFAGNVQRATSFEWARQLGKIGKPLDRGEWQMTPPTVNAYYDGQMNDINFPAGVLQPPLFDAKLDDAPNYGNTGATIGHELTHGFDDEGRQFDAKGNLRDWWTAADAKAFQDRAQCVVDQYGAYPVIDDIKINSKLTLGEDVADLGGTYLAYVAWKAATAQQTLANLDGFTPDQRFFIGMAQWACSNERPERERLLALTNPHSPTRYRVNGVVANLPEFAKAFACKAGQPMVREKPCKVW
jgi:endothelin-converting enzyme/putative endopeptidase